MTEASKLALCVSLFNLVPKMAQYYLLMIPIMRGHLVTGYWGYNIIIIIKDDDTFIFIAIDNFLPRPTFILELFNFKLINLTIQRWCPINLCMVHTMKLMLILL